MIIGLNKSLIKLLGSDLEGMTTHLTSDGLPSWTMVSLMSEPKKVKVESIVMAVKAVFPDLVLNGVYPVSEPIPYL